MIKFSIGTAWYINSDEEMLWECIIQIRGGRGSGGFRSWRFLASIKCKDLQWHFGHYVTCSSIDVIRWWINPLSAIHSTTSKGFLSQVPMYSWKLCTRCGAGRKNYCTNPINSSHLVTCDWCNKILVLLHCWGRCDHQKNLSECWMGWSNYEVNIWFWPVHNTLNVNSEIL